MKKGIMKNPALKTILSLLFVTAVSGINGQSTTSILPLTNREIIRLLSSQGFTLGMNITLPKTSIQGLTSIWVIPGQVISR
jgi:hypothetical protein